MINKRITELYSKKLAKEATAAELLELEEYLRNNPEEDNFQEIVGKWWNAGKSADTSIESEQEEHFKYILWQANEKNSGVDTVNQTPLRAIRQRKYWQVALAAAAIICLVSFSTWKYITHTNASEIASVQENEIVARRGIKSKIILPDGTQVWLNSESKLVYNNVFNGKLREVTLEGEAYFDVVKDHARPFIVHTSGINIKVLGTAFNVKSYPRDPTIEATLVRGLIEVEKNNQVQSSKILLHPNEKLVFTKALDKTTTSILNNDEAAIAKHPVALKPQTISISTLPKNLVDSARIETSWVYGRFLFEGDTFKDLADKMERWFNITITFRDNKVANNYRFRGVFANENIEEALQALQLTAPFKYTITGNEVVIDKK
jgi:ferric-dicitrate binding protein FerR (iron transport regulator)